MTSNYIGGLAQGAALDPSRVDSLEQENARLRAEVADMWRHIGLLHDEREAPATPGPMQAVNAMRAAVADLTKRLAELEARTPKAIKAAATDATKLAVDAVGHAYGPLLADLGEGFDKLEKTANEIGKTLDGLGRTVDDVIRTSSKREAHLSALAEWQIDTAAGHLIGEARQHVGQ